MNILIQIPNNCSSYPPVTLSSLRVGLIKDLSLTLKYVRISNDGGSRLFPRSGPTERLFNIHAQKAKPKQLEPKTWQR